MLLAVCAVAMAEEETLKAEEQVLISPYAYSAYGYASPYGYAAYPYAAYPYSLKTVGKVFVHFYPLHRGSSTCCNIITYLLICLYNNSR